MKLLFTLIVCWAFIGIRAASADDDHGKLLTEAERLAKQYQESELESDANADLENKVRSLVGQSFDIRQTSQLAQIEQLRVKLDLAETAIQERAAMRERIVERKVEDLLAGQSADWKPKSADETEFIDVIGIGDVVAIHLEGVLPMSRPNEAPASPQVTVLNSGRVVMGFPFTVGSDGGITLPMVGPVQIAGMTVRQAEQLIEALFVEKNILRAGRALPTITLIPQQDSAANLPKLTQVKDISVEDIVIEQQSPRSQSTGLIRSIGSSTPSNTGVSSFDDTYGRLRRARELADQAALLNHQDRISRDQLERAASRTATPAILESLESQIKSNKKFLDKVIFELELERDYIADVILQLETDLQAKMSLVKQSEDDLDRSEQLHRSGVMTSSELSKAQAETAKTQSELEIATLKLNQYKNIADRWRAIVGDQLKATDESKQRVDEGSSR